MSAMSHWSAYNSLQHMLKKATWATPAENGCNLCLGSPKSDAMSEVGTGSGITCQTIGFMCGTPAGSATATNSASVSFGTLTSAVTVSGVVVKDTTASAGNMYFGGVLATARTCASGDSIVIASGGLTLTLI